MKSFVVKKLRTTCYNPRATGLTEKYNKFIEKYLTSYESFDDKEQDLWVREVAFTSNYGVHSA